MAKRLAETNKLPSGTSASNSLFAVYKSRATARLIPFELDREYFKSIVVLPCAYCASPPMSLFKVQSGNDSITYNGLDRVDNEKGYVNGNVKPCCRVCNTAKGTMTLHQFRDWVKRVAELFGS